VSPDFSDLLRAFNDHEVEYLVVGAHALAAHGYVRATKDFDVWVRPDEVNAERTLAALKDYGAPLHDLNSADLVSPGTVFQMGMPPLRIDILTAIDGLRFADAWPNRVHTDFGGQPTYVLSRGDLIINKKASGRLQDLADVENLEQSTD
jgi:Nucleotidyltransferase of unknown function (DUF6036)